MKVIIVGLHKAEVLLALYNNAKFAGKDFKSQPILNILFGMNPDGCVEKAHGVINEALQTGKFYFDNLDLGAGPRPLKVDLSGFYFDSDSYDNSHDYEGYAQDVIEQLRKVTFDKLKGAPRNSCAEIISQIGLLSESKPKVEGHLTSAGKSLKF